MCALSPSPVLDTEKLLQGDVPTSVALLHYLLLDASLPFARHICAHRQGLSSVSDERFVQLALRVLRELFDYHQPMSATMFLSVGQFRDRRLHLLCDVCALVADFHRTSWQGQKAKGETGRPGISSSWRAFHQRTFNSLNLQAK